MNPYLALIIANVIWGIGAPLYKVTLQTVPPFTLAFLRFAGAALLILPFYLKHYQAVTKRQLMECFFVGFFGITINISFFFLGLQKAPSINAPIIGSSGPIFLYFLSVIFLKEKFRWKIFLGMMIGLLGVLFIILAPLLRDGNGITIGMIEGNVYFLLAMFGNIMNPFIQKGVLKTVKPVTIAFWTFVFGAISFFPFMTTELQRWSFSQVDMSTFAMILFGVIFSSALAYTLLNYGVHNIDAEEVGLFGYFDPLSAIIVAIPVLHEYPDIYFILGALFVFGGIFIAEGRLHWHPFHKLKMKS